MENIWITILSSAGVASVISAIASYIINNTMQKRRYKKDYYKTIINKRLDAYQHIETQIQVLKMVEADNTDAKLYMYMFNGDSNQYFESQKHVRFALTKSLWISQEMLDVLNDFQKHLFEIENHISDDSDNNILIGKKWYPILSEDRCKIEDCLKKDMQDMYDAESFLKTKVERKKVIINVPINS